MSKKNNFDYIVIGSELSSALIAQKLAGHGYSVALIPEKESLEDFRAGSASPKIRSHEPFMSLAFNTESERLLNWLEDQFFSTEGIYSHREEATALTFDSGQFKTFLGFGDRKFKTIEALQTYIDTQRIVLEHRPQVWLNQLLDHAKFEFIDRSSVTALTLEGKVIQSLTINGQKEITCNKDIIFCGDPKQLIELLPTESLAGKEKQKIAKATLLTRLNLSFDFGPEAEYNSGTHVLMGTKDDFEPFIGEFFLAEEGVKSHWTYLLESEKAESPEEIASVIKYMKRQLKRSYPELMENIKSESINVYSHTHGQIDLGELVKPKHINNLCLGSSHFSRQHGLAAHLDRAEMILNQIIAPQAATKTNKEIEATV